MSFKTAGGDNVSTLWQLETATGSLYSIRELRAGLSVEVLRLGQMLQKAIG